MNERIKLIRKAHKMTQTDFGAQIGVKGNTITNYESGLRTPSDAVIVSICREFNVNEEWLRTGNGEMFVQTDDTLIDELAHEYALDDLDKKILAGYLALPAQSKKVFKEFLLNFAQNIGDSQPIPLRAVSRRGGEAVADLSKEEAAAAHLERERLLKSDIDQPDL
ncbi:helix-turn-helix transcriptional regulator [Agathobaculum sp. NTUH-O15-33]|uniref:helix-turn-helix domain-containing protein n=1 Tax=Agathobaculum sp. NTUH-O15-33 TaxID=3079302 RepID=UPI0029585D2F|nr:helix-turn-helix transcriptional regulator [Agathobaculum sp. NTUH-O15-33]WNX85727.1 helix-turn-helix transcriptional regulator [Agathobaculum sp. NTUH-O15-33]